MHFRRLWNGMFGRVGGQYATLSPDIRKILINNTKIIYKNTNKNHIQILVAIIMKNKKNAINKKSIHHKYKHIKDIQILTIYPNWMSQPHP